jgi:hypothetical protein
MSPLQTSPRGFLFQAIGSCCTLSPFSQRLDSCQAIPRAVISWRLLLVRIRCSKASARMKNIHDIYDNNSLDCWMMRAYIPNQAVG